MKTFAAPSASPEGLPAFGTLPFNHLDVCPFFVGIPNPVRDAEKFIAPEVGKLPFLVANENLAEVLVGYAKLIGQGFQGKNLDCHQNIHTEIICHKCVDNQEHTCDNKLGKQIKGEPQTAVTVQGSGLQTSITKEQTRMNIPHANQGGVFARADEDCWACEGSGGRWVEYACFDGSGTPDEEWHTCTECGGDGYSLLGRILNDVITAPVWPVELAA